MNAVVDRNSLRSTAADLLKGDATLAVLPHLATKEDLAAVDKKVDAIAVVLPHLATKAEMQAVRIEVQAVRTDLQAQISGLLKWIIGTGLASAGVAAAVSSAISRYL